MDLRVECVLIIPETKKKERKKEGTLVEGK